MTLPNKEVKSNRSYIGLSIYSNGNKWEIVTTISSGSGVQILARGTYVLSGNRLSMMNLNGTLYGEYLVSLNNSEIILTQVNGKGVERYIYGGKLQTK